MDHATCPVVKIRAYGAHHFPIQNAAFLTEFDRDWYAPPDQEARSVECAARSLRWQSGTTVCWANSTARAQGSSAEQPHLGPSFPCPSPNDPLAQLMCSSPDLSRADLSFVQAYQALRAQLDPNGQNKLRQEAVTFNQAVRSQCGIGAPNSGKTASPAAIPCVLQRYLSQRNIWAGRLTGPAAEEAARSLQAHVALQANLKALGFLTPDTVVDGVYGPATRTAILQWQQSRGRSLTGLLGNSDGALLEQQAVTTTAALLEQQAAALQSQPSPSSVGPTETASRLAVPSYAQLPTLAQKPAGQATPPPPAAVVQTPSAIQPPPAALQPEQQVDEQQTNIPANCSDVTVDDLNEDFRSGGSNVKAIQIIHSEPVPNSDAINKLKKQNPGLCLMVLGEECDPEIEYKLVCIMRVFTNVGDVFASFQLREIHGQLSTFLRWVNPG